MVVLVWVCAVLLYVMYIEAAANVAGSWIQAENHQQLINRMQIFWTFTWFDNYFVDPRLILFCHFNPGDIFYVNSNFPAAKQEEEPFACRQVGLLCVSK